MHDMFIGKRIIINIQSLRGIGSRIYGEKTFCIDAYFKGGTVTAHYKNERALMEELDDLKEFIVERQKSTIYIKSRSGITPGQLSPVEDMPSRPGM
jgi:hypothetical protein